MATPHGASAALLLDGYSLTGFARSAQAEPTQEILDASTFGLASRAKLPGLKHGTFSAEMFYDTTTATGSWDIIKGKFGAQTPGVPAPATINFGPNGFALGAQIAMLYANTVKAEPKMVFGDLTMAMLTAEAEEDGVDFGVSLHALSVETDVSSDGAAVDNATSSANGGVGALHVTAIAGAAPSVVFKVQHSTDNSTWVDLITFSAVTAANSTRRTEVAAGTTVRRYLRYSYAFGGTTSSVTFHVSFARR